jgi:hypothetical protein
MVRVLSPKKESEFSKQNSRMARTLGNAKSSSTMVTATLEESLTSR